MHHVRVFCFVYLNYFYDGFVRLFTFILINLFYSRFTIISFTRFIRHLCCQFLVTLWFHPLFIFAWSVTMFILLPHVRVTVVLFTHSILFIYCDNGRIFVRLSRNDLYINIFFCHISFILSLRTSYLTIVTPFIYFLHFIITTSLFPDFIYVLSRLFRSLIVRILCVVIKKTEVTSRFGVRVITASRRAQSRDNLAFQYRRNRKSLLDTFQARRTWRCLCNCDVEIPACHTPHRPYVRTSHEQNSAASSSSESFCTGNIITSSLTSDRFPTRRGMDATENFRD